MTAADVNALFGKRVRQLRKAKGVSQEAFAYAIQIDRSYFGSIERGERNVSLDNICLIAEGLGVEPAELLTSDALLDPESPPGHGGRRVARLVANGTELSRQINAVAHHVRVGRAG